MIKKHFLAGKAVSFKKLSGNFSGIRASRLLMAPFSNAKERINYFRLIKKASIAAFAAAGSSSMPIWPDW